MILRPHGRLFASMLTTTAARANPKPQSPQQQDKSVPAQTYPQYIRDPHHVTSAFYAALTRHGIRRDSILARVTARLRLKYGHPAPLDLAIDALRPTIRYIRPKDTRAAKYFVPIAVWPESGVGMAVRWVVRAAEERRYKGMRPDLEKGLWEELDAVLNGSSGLFAKKLNMHRNPN
jgi:hypothetical protein